MSAHVFHEVYLHINWHFEDDRLLYWQRGYGVVSFGKNNLDWVLGYIANQKEHHARENVFERLERSMLSRMNHRRMMSKDMTKSPAEAGLQSRILSPLSTS